MHIDVFWRFNKDMISGLNKCFNGWFLLRVAIIRDNFRVFLESVDQPILTKYIVVLVKHFSWFFYVL